MMVRSEYSALFLKLYSVSIQNTDHEQPKDKVAYLGRNALLGQPSTHTVLVLESFMAADEFE